MSKGGFISVRGRSAFGLWASRQSGIFELGGSIGEDQVFESERDELGIHTSVGSVS